MSRTESVIFVTDSGGEQTLKVQNLDDDTELIFWHKDVDEAIDGTLRPNIKGLRESYTLRWDLNTEPSEVESLIENILADVDSGKDFFYFGIDKDSARRVTLNDDNILKIRYNNQHGIYSPMLKMISHEVSGISLTIIDYRFITEAVTVYLDYGLITEAVTEQQDFGFIA